MLGDVCHMHAVCIVRQPYDQLGFSIRGGSEHGLGIYVSELDPDSAAGLSGRCDVGGGELSGRLRNLKRCTTAIFVFFVNRLSWIMCWRQHH